jgi:hypothetical protein
MGMQERFPDTVNLLLSRGADPEISDDYGSTPVEYAAALGPEKTRRGQIVGSFFRYGFGVKRIVMAQETSEISKGGPADPPCHRFTDPVLRGHSNLRTPAVASRILSYTPLRGKLPKGFDE